MDIVVLVNAPDAPSDYAKDAMTETQRTNRMVYLVLGWSQIMGSLVTGSLLYVIGGIGQAILDLWKTQQESSRGDDKK